MLNRRTMLGGLSAAALLPLAARAGVPASSGYLPVNDGRIFFVRLGQPGKTPLVMLHGGPGGGHDYLLPMAMALADEREVIVYDQLGCGKADAPENPAIYTVARYAEELQRVRDGLQLPKIKLYGHSWGGMLAIEYLAGQRRTGVDRLVLSSALASGPQANAGFERLIDALPEGKGARVRALSAAGQQDSKEYAAIVRLYYARHIDRHSGPIDPAYRASLKNMASSPALQAMNGPDPFLFTGSLKSWDRRADLARIRLPTLITTGEFDEITLDCQQTIHAGIKGSRLVVLPGLSHMTMFEDPAGYTALVRGFLNEAA
ncbi:MAG: proline iminopeptidase-family hydrolase [Sphingomonadales bacterium]